MRAIIKGRADCLILSIKLGRGRRLRARPPTRNNANHVRTAGSTRHGGKHDRLRRGNAATIKTGKLSIPGWSQCKASLGGVQGSLLSPVALGFNTTHTAFTHTAFFMLARFFFWQGSFMVREFHLFKAFKSIIIILKCYNLLLWHYYWLWVTSCLKLELQNYESTVD